MVRNDVAQDDRLSYRARGVLVAILSRPDNYETNAVNLAAEGKEGRDAIVTALDELEEFGFLDRVRRQREGGTWTTALVVYDVPDSWKSDAPTPGNPLVPTPENPPAPTPDSQGLKDKTRNKTKNNTRGRVEDRVAPDGPLADRFEEFYRVFPVHKGKEPARRSWAKAIKSGADPTRIIAGARAYADWVARTKPERPKWPQGWLTDRRWEDEDQSVESSAPSNDWSSGW
jgi:hypothetical protein